MGLQRLERGQIDPKRFRGDEGGNACAGIGYGHPARNGCGGSDNVVLQWLFDEASGSIVDEVESASLSVTGTPAFDTAAGGSNHSAISPGIQYESSENHSGTGFASSGWIGSNDFTWEYWLQDITDAGSFHYVFEHKSSSDASRCYLVHNPTTDVVTYRIQNNAGTTVSTTFPLTYEDYGDGVPHKFRITNDRSGNAEWFHEGSSLGTVSISAASGALEVDKIYIGSNQAGTSNLDGVLFELRLSHNLINDSGNSS